MRKARLAGLHEEFLQEEPTPAHIALEPPPRVAFSAA
jgi:hypothetical protein